MAYLSALSIAVNFADDCLPTDSDSLIENDLLTFIAPSWRETHTEQEWASMVLGHLQSDDINGVDLTTWLMSSLTLLAPPLCTAAASSMCALCPPPAATSCERDTEGFMFVFGHQGMSIYTFDKQLVHTFSVL